MKQEVDATTAHDRQDTNLTREVSSSTICTGSIQQPGQEQENACCIECESLLTTIGRPAQLVSGEPTNPAFTTLVFKGADKCIQT